MSRLLSKIQLTVLSERHKIRGKFKRILTLMAGVALVAGVIAATTDVGDVRAAMRRLGLTALMTTTAPDSTIIFGPKNFVAAQNNTQINFVEGFQTPRRIEEIDSAGNTVWSTNFNVYTMRMRHVGGSFTTATVTLNGKQIASSADFAASTYIERSVALNIVEYGNNTLSVTVKGAVGAGLNIDVIATPYSAYDLFGPKVYTKTATTPTHFTETFSRPADASTPYTLSARASVAGTKATITLNGTQVIKSTDFGTGVTSVSKTVSLIASNSMAIDVTGSTGTTITVEVTAVDKTPPTLTIAAPPPNLITNTATLTVTGTSRDREDTQVTVNGVRATMSGTPKIQYSAAVPLAVGVNTLAIRAMDHAGNHTDSTRTVTRDTVGPTLTVTSPADNSYTNQDAVTVAGTVSDATAVTVKVNGTSYPVGQGGAFSGSYQLSAGANFLTITATDAAGNVKSEMRKVTQAKQPPTLTITSPAANFATKTSPIAVSGSVSGTTPLSVSVNGVSLPVTNGAFSGSVPLAEGANDLTFTATDPATNQTVVHRTGTLDTHPPVLTLTAPTDASYSNATTVTVSGTATDASAVTVAVNGTPVSVGANGAFTYDFTLANGANAITVTATDAATNSTSVQRTVTRDITPPTLTVSAPADGIYSNADSLDVSGSATDASPVTVKVNGNAVTLGTGGAFTYRVGLTEGSNVLSLSATDAANNTASAARTLIRDKTPPSFDDMQYCGSLTKLTSCTVTVVASDASPITVQIGGTTVSPDATGKYVRDVPLVEGWNYIGITIVDAAGNSEPSVSLGVLRDTQPPTIDLSSPADGQTVSIDQVVVSGTIHDSNTDKNSFTATVNGTSVPVDVDDFTFSTTVHLSSGANTITVVATEQVGNSTSVTRTVNFTGESENLPPDPVTVAPKLDATVATTTLASTSFLYTGPNPIQTGVAAGTIQKLSVAEIRGSVQTRNGAPLSGVRVSVFDHPEFGQTLSRADGAFDLAINGGGLITLDYEKAGYLSAQRQVIANWQAFAHVDAVTLINLDPASTAVDFSQPAQAAQGSPVTDQSGTRQATMIFKGGTHASMRMPDGTTRDLPSLTVRATEYTVGATGPSAMPGELPPASAYTYAVELSADEAIAAGATEVTFDKPVALYVDNFLNFPTGIAVPVGFYDRSKAAWIGTHDGRVVKILAISNGKAVLDVDGSGVAASSDALGALGIDDAELTKLGELYTPGKTLWRVQVNHFTPWDCNWGVTFPPDARPPKVKNPDAKKTSKRTCKGGGSIIGCERQTLGESLNLAGTSLSLNYQTDGTPGYRDAYTTDIPLGGSELPPDVIRIELEVSIAGQVTNDSFPALPNQIKHFVWDGKDVFGRTVQGVQEAHIRIGYVYNPVYASSPQTSTGIGFGGWGTTPISGDRARNEITLWQELDIALGSRGSGATTIGGWTFNVHHAFDPQSRILYLGDGTQRDGGELPTVATTIANAECSQFDDTGHCINHAVPGANALDLYMSPQGIGIARDGSMYLADVDYFKIWRVNAAGTLELIAGDGTNEFRGDGIPATSTGILPAGQLRVAPDGSVYFVDYTRDGQIRRVDKNGIITTAAGSGICGDSVRTGIPATQADLCVYDFTLGNDGTLYIADGTEVYRVGADGIITRIVGDGSYARCPSNVASYTCAEGKPANAHAVLNSISGMAVGPDGALYLANGEDRVFNSTIIYRIGNDGVIRRFAGNGNRFRTFDDRGNGKSALNAVINSYFVEPAVAPDGTLYFVGADGYVTHIEQTGILRLVGGCLPFPAPVNCVREGGQRATATRLFTPRGIDFGPDGRLYILDDFARRIDKPLPALDIGDVLIASEDGSQIYHFNADGRHLETLDALLGHRLLEFGYSGSGLLTTITDTDGNVVSVERDGAGLPTGIVAPFGQRTSLTVNAANYLAAAKGPGAPATTMTYYVDGLLKTFRDRNDNLHQFTYDSTGLLIRDDNANGGFKTLTRAVTDSSSTVTVATGLGVARRYSTIHLPNGATQRTSVNGAGLETGSVSETNGVSTLIAPDGTLTTISTGADPRLGMQASVPQTVTTLTPAGVQSTVTRTRSVILADPRDRLSLLTQTDSTIVNGHVYIRTFDKTNRSLTTRSPEGRTSTVYFDTKGHMVRSELSGMASTDFGYDTRGRLLTISRAGRLINYTYDAFGNLAKIATPLRDSITFAYDSAAHVTTIGYADGNHAAFTYDGNGNVTSVTPPGRAAHSFSFNAADLNEVYSPPAIGGDSGMVRYSYDIDQNWKTTTNGNGIITTIGYDAGGRGSLLSSPSGAVQVGYDPQGRLATLSDSVRSTVLNLGYDGFLGLSATAGGVTAGTVSVAYDEAGQIHSVSVNALDPIQFGYDGDGLLTSAGILTLTRDPAKGVPAAATLGGVSESWSTDSLGVATSAIAAFGSSELLAGAYQSDSLGRITQVIETEQGIQHTLTYKYGALGRLVEVRDGGSLVAAYSYDANGNRTDETGPNGTISSAYDGQDRLLSRGTTLYRYTPNGEVRLRITGTDTTKYDYDASGALIKVVIPNGTSVEYVIDGTGRRIGRKVNGSLAEAWLYGFGTSPIAELDANNNVVSQFVYGVSSVVPAYLIKNGVTYAIITDHTGSVRLVVDVATGTIAQRLNYDAWGRVTENTNPGFQPFGFGGGLYDAVSGLVMFGARSYDAEAGRWISKDPAGFRGGDSNLYAYALNDPINFRDPSGRIVANVVGAVIGAAFAGVTAYLNHEDASAITRATLIGAATGAIGGPAFSWVENVIARGLMSGAVGGAVGDYIDQVAHNFINCPDFTDLSNDWQNLTDLKWSEFFTAAGAGAIGGSLGANVGSQIMSKEQLEFAKSAFARNQAEFIESFLSSLGAGLIQLWAPHVPEAYSPVHP